MLPVRYERTSIASAQLDVVLPEKQSRTKAHKCNRRTSLGGLNVDKVAGMLHCSRQGAEPGMPFPPVSPTLPHNVHAWPDCSALSCVVVQIPSRVLITAARSTEDLCRPPRLTLGGTMMLRAAATLLRQAEQAASVSMMARSMATAASTKMEIKLVRHTDSRCCTVSQPVAPLQLSGTSASIATLVWQVASKENVLDKVQDEIHQVRMGEGRVLQLAFGAYSDLMAHLYACMQMAECIKTLPDLRRMASDPLFPPLVRKSVVDSVLKDSQATEVTKKLFCKSLEERSMHDPCCPNALHAASLAEENILAAVFDIAKAYDDLQLAHKKEVYCTIVTAQPLDKMEREEVQKEAAKYVEKGFKLVAQEKIVCDMFAPTSFKCNLGVLQVDKKLQGGFVLEFEDRLVDMSDSKKSEEYRDLVDKLERDLLG
eukprot:306662-Chlamydomonas_euryale.AAC.4